MNWNRSFRASATMAVTLALILGALAAPALVSAKPAPLTFGFGPGFDQSLETGALPTEVSPGSTVAFEVWARNSGKSNIAKLFLTVSTEAAFEGVIVTNAGKTSGSCSASSGGIALKCSWKPFKPGASTHVRVILNAPESGSSLPVNFEWSSNGYVLGGNNSHGDLFTADDSAALNGNLDMFAGRYVIGANLVVQTNPDLGEGNPQSTKIIAPTNGIPVTAGEDNNLSECEELFGEDCFGQASVLNVNNGQTFPGGFTVEVVYVGEFPDAQFVHFFDDGTFEELEECDYYGPEPPCFELEVEEGFTFVTFYLTENGKTFGH
jgi:hypothetical protein